MRKYSHIFGGRGLKNGRRPKPFLCFLLHTCQLLLLVYVVPIHPVPMLLFASLRDTTWARTIICNLKGGDALVVSEL